MACLCGAKTRTARGAVILAARLRLHGPPARAESFTARLRGAESFMTRECEAKAFNPDSLAGSIHRSAMSG